MHHNFLSDSLEDLTFAKSLLESDELVAFPTETVYGLGGNAYSDVAVRKIFAYKGRPAFNPLIAHYSCFDRASEDASFTKSAVKIAEVFCPGSVTIICKKRETSKLSSLATAGLSTVAIRVPSHCVATNLLQMLSFPLVAPSANRSTKLSPTTAMDVSKSLASNNVLSIIDGGTCEVGLESTIVDASFSDVSVRILRHGVIGADDIVNKCGIDVVDHLFNESKTESQNHPTTTNSLKICDIICPGQLLKHYSPNKPIVINANGAEKEDGLLAFGAPFSNNCEYLMNLSENMDLKEAASNLFFMLNALDSTDASRICVMPIFASKSSAHAHIAVAINDKLLRASAN